MWGSRSVVIIIDHFLFQIPCRPSDGATMGTEADICKRTGMLTNMIWQLPQLTPLSYLVIFQVAPEPKGGVTLGAGRPPEIMQAHSSFGHSYIICLQVRISQHYNSPPYYEVIFKV